MGVHRPVAPPRRSALLRQRHPDFLNQAPAPLTADEDLTGHVERVLTTSRAHHLALDGYPHDREAERLAGELDRAREQLAETQTRLEALHDQHAQTPWYQRRNRQDLNAITNNWQLSADRWQTKVDDLTHQLDERPAAAAPKLTRAHDPLAALEPQVDLQRELERRRLERELNRDLGHDLGIDR